MGSLILAATAFAAVIWVLPTRSVASPVYSRRTDKECTYCHPPTNYNLTDAGKYYQEHKTLKGYQPKEDQKKGETKKPDTTGTTRTPSH